MPRRKTNEAKQEIRRSTRTSIGKAEEEAKQEKAPPTRPSRSRNARSAQTPKMQYISPESSPQSSPSPAPAPAKTKRGGRARGATSAKGGRASRSKVEEEVIELSDQEVDEPEEEESDGDEFVPTTSKTRGKGKGTPTKKSVTKKSPRASAGASPGRSRSRSTRGAAKATPKRTSQRRKKIDDESDEEGDDWRSDEEDAPVVVTPSRTQRSRRSAQGPTDVGSPPRRSSSRAAAKAASASIEAQVAEEGEVVDLDESSMSSKRGIEGEEKEGQGPAEKRAKVDDDKKKEAEGGEDDEEMPAADNKSDVEEVDGEAKDQGKTDAVEDEVMEVESEAKIEKKDEEAEEKMDDKEPEEEEKKVEGDVSEKADAGESTDVEPGDAEEQKEEAIEEDYVMADKADVPSPHSADVNESLPKEKQANGENTDMEKDEADDSAKPIEEPTSVEPTCVEPASVEPTSVEPTSVEPTSVEPTSVEPANCSEDKPTDTQPTSLPPSSSNGPTPEDTSSLNCGDTSKATCANSSPLFSRSLVKKPSSESTPQDPDKTFSVVSYNVLADCHAQRDYTSEGMWISKEHLALTYRNELIVKELKYLDADVICLQEVGPDHFDNMLLPSLRKLGYEGAMIKRTDSVHNEGEATFYRTSRFDLIASRPVELSVLAHKDLDSSGLETEVLSAVKSAVDTPAVAMITQLKCVRSGSTLTVANIHNMWDRFGRQDLQCIMVSCAIRELVNVAGGPDQPHVICGDFNSWPGSCVYQLTKEGYLNDASMASLNNAPSVSVSEGKDGPLVNLWWKGFQHTSSLKSAYATIQGSEPLTSKFPHDGVMRAVDFIWYGGTEVQAVLATSPPHLIEAGVPNSVFPSDHLSTKALLSFK